MAISNPLVEEPQEDQPYSPQQGSTVGVAQETRVGGQPLGPGPSSVAVPLPPRDRSQVLTDFTHGLSEAGPPGGGGLPFGPPPQQPMQPPPSLALARRPQQAMQLGGQPPSIDQMIAQHLEAANAYPQMSFRERLMGGQGRYDEAMRQLPTLAPLAKEQREAQAQREARTDARITRMDKTITEVTKEMSEYHGRGANEQTILRPVLAQSFMARLELAGVPPERAQAMVEDGLADSGLVRRIMASQDDPVWTPEQRVHNAGQVADGRNAEERLKIQAALDAKEQAAQEARIRAGLAQTVAQYRVENKIPPGQLVPGDDFATWALTKMGEWGKSPIVLGAWATVAKDDRFLAQSGITPGSITLKRLEQETLGPKFHHLEAYPKTLIPYLTDASGLGPIELDRMAATDPNRFALYVREAQKREGAVLLERSTNQGAARALVPEKPTAGEREKLTDDVNGLQLAAEMRRLYKPDYVGPITGRIGEYRADYTGAISEREAQFRQSNSHFNNALIKSLGGVVVPPAEFNRIMAERPGLNLPPVTFEARMKSSEENLTYLAYLRRAQMEKTGVDMSQLPPLPPLPKRFEDRPELLGKGGRSLGPTKVEPADPTAPIAPPPVKRSGASTRIR